MFSVVVLEMSLNLKLVTERVSRVVGKLLKKRSCSKFEPLFARRISILEAGKVATLSSEVFTKPDVQNHDLKNEKAPIIILHGLLGSKNNWKYVAGELVKKLENRRIFTVDIRNHGDSPHTEEFNLRVIATDLLYFIKDQNLKKVSLIGHSMGGKASMVFSSMFPDLLQSLMVVDIGPQRTSSNLMAVKNILKSIQNLDLDPFLPVQEARKKASLQLGKTLKDPNLVSFIVSNIMTNENKEEANWRWKFNLRVIMKNFDNEIAQPPLVEENVFQGPVMFIAGGKSDYLKPEDEPKIRELYRNVQFVYIPEAGHWVHADSPQRFVAEATNFFLNDEHTK